MTVMSRSNRRSRVGYSFTAPPDGAVELELSVAGTGYVGAVSDDVTIKPGQRSISKDDVPDIEIIQEAGTGAWVIQTTYIWTEDYIHDNYRLSHVGDDLRAAPLSTTASRPPGRP